MSSKHNFNSYRTKFGTALAGASLLGLTAAAGIGHAAPTLPVPTGVAAPTATASNITPSDYVLAPQDQLEISVQGHDELHQTVTVLTDGTFRYPIAGKVVAVGKTVDGLEADLTKKLSDICMDPQVTVLVREAHLPKISVIGTVKAPGQYEYRPGMRLLELIAATGGALQEPQLTQVSLVTDGGAKITPIDLAALLNDNDATQNPTLSPGDMLVFTPKNPEQSMVQVIGQVGKPGQYSVVKDGATVLALLTEAGSATPQAALTQAQLMHAGQVQNLDLHPLQYNLSDPVGKTKLVAGDTLLIPENKQKIAVLGEVRAPSVYLIPDGENLPITQALAQAGGPTVDGDKKQVGVLRLGPDHKRHLVAYDMDKLLKGDASVSNPDLQPGDILVVPTRHKGHNIAEYVNQIPGIYTLTHL